MRASLGLSTGSRFRPVEACLAALLAVTPVFATLLLLLTPCVRLGRGGSGR